jgi:hypothetical protein
MHGNKLTGDVTLGRMTLEEGKGSWIGREHPRASE